jgi:MFS family permease
LRRTFQALGTRNYRLFFVGQVVSVTGTWMQKVAQDWLILELGGGPLELSIGVALQQLPTLLLGMWGGLLVDRGSARKLLLATQVLLACLALALGLLAVGGLASLPVVYAMALAVGCLSVVDTPARQAFVVDMVGPEQAANAVSLNSSINNSAKLVGPAVAGSLIALTSTGVAFLINAATFVAIVVALLRMDPDSLHPRPPVARGRGQVLEGLRYAWTQPMLRTPLEATLLVSMFSQNWRVTLPPLAVRVFGGGPSSYGLLLSALGVGALVGALLCAYLARPTLGLMEVQAVVLGLLMLSAALAPTYVALVAIMVGVGAGNTSFNTTSNAFVLLRSSPGMRGRVMSLRTLVSNGSTPIGSVTIGWICQAASPRVGLGVGGGVALLTAALLLRARWRRPSGEPDGVQGWVTGPDGVQGPAAGPDGIQGPAADPDGLQGPP